MPTYDYECQTCGERFEAKRESSLRDYKLPCVKCGEAARRFPSKVNIAKGQLKKGKTSGGAEMKRSVAAQNTIEGCVVTGAGGAAVTAFRLDGDGAIKNCTAEDVSTGARIHKDAKVELTGNTFKKVGTAVRAVDSGRNRAGKKS